MYRSSHVSLTQRASIAVISSLWNQKDIISDIENLLFRNHACKYWADIEKDVLSSLRAIEIPNELKLNLENLMQPLGMQIVKWISLTRPVCQSYPHISKPIKFMWTEMGVLDYTETTRQVIECSSDKVLCFCLACIFCIDDIILKLWPDVGHILCEKIKNNPFSFVDMLVIYWIHHLSGEIEKLMNLTEYCGIRNTNAFAFLLALDEKNITSLTYFFQKIPSEKTSHLISFSMQKMFHIPSLRDGNILFFLFSHLSESDISQIPREHSYGILTSFLEWPCQEYFLKAVNSSWNKLSNINYLDLFQDILECMSLYHIGNIYKNLVKQFWQSTPLSFKKYIISKCTSGSFLGRVFRHENADDIVQMIFNDCSPDERQQMIFYFEGINLCDFLVKKERWKSLKFFIESCIPSQAVMDKFIEQYANLKPCYSDNEAGLRTVILFKKIREWY